MDTTHGSDPRTYDTAQRIRQEEVELLSMVRDGEINSAGLFVRGEPGDAPYSTNRRFDDSA